MKRFEKIKKRKSETINTYLNRVYKQNKTKIDTAYTAYTNISNEKFIRNSFKNLVKEFMEDGYTLNQSVTKVLNKEMFTPIKERYQSNVYEAIVNEKEVYKEFRNLTRDKGRFTKVELNDFNYVGLKNIDGKDYTVYTYNNVYIYIAQSPKGDNQSAIQVSKEQWY